MFGEGKYFLWRGRKPATKRKKIFGEGKYLNYREVEIPRWERRKMLERENIFYGGKEKRRRKRRKLFGEQKLMVTLNDDNRVNIVQSAFSKVKNRRQRIAILSAALSQLSSPGMPLAMSLLFHYTINVYMYLCGLQCDSFGRFILIAIENQRSDCLTSISLRPALVSLSPQRQTLTHIIPTTFL